jgi:hypothetical protein
LPFEFNLQRYTSAVWISVATFLVYTIWRINPRPDGVLEPLLPRKAVA